MRVARISLILLMACTAPTEKKTDLLLLAHYTAGTYEASLPCSDCISLEYQLELDTDSTCIEHITYLGKPNANFEVHGTWLIDYDSVLTFTNTRLAAKLKANASGTLTLTEMIEVHPQKKPAVLLRIGTHSNNQADLLNNVWVLEAINTNEISESDYAHERARLEFNAKEGKLTGTTGCNRINGTYTTTGNNLALGPLLTTKMACPGSAEATFTQALQQTTAFKILDLRLYLLSGNTEVLRFKKAP
ncbi:MAG: META domain-containing protein [Cyclobacteriaceae bacterium]|nr:META domain-containing protein [Cyclobacteriaceae bacterium]